MKALSFWREPRSTTAKPELGQGASRVANSAPLPWVLRKLLLAAKPTEQQSSEPPNGARFWRRPAQRRSTPPLSTIMTRRVGIGLTAGPSLATIDAALVEIDPNPIRLKPVELIEFLPVPVPPDLRARLVVARSGAATTPAAMSELDTEVGKLLADAAKKVAGARLGEVEFIASCGMPVARTSASSEESKSDDDDGAGAPPEVVRIGDASVLARDTAKCVVSDFVPAESDETGVFSTADAVLFRHLLDDTRTIEWHRKPTADTSCALVVVHFGAMASMTALSGTGRVLRSFDCGPGNMVMNLIVQNAVALGLEPKDPKDEALAEKLQQPGGMRFDEGGKIAKGGASTTAAPRTRRSTSRGRRPSSRGRR